MGPNYLWFRHGDANNAVLAAVGFVRISACTATAVRIAPFESVDRAAHGADAVYDSGQYRLPSDRQDLVRDPGRNEAMNP